jgi:hypothetical protein
VLLPEHLPEAIRAVLAGPPAPATVVPPPAAAVTSLAPAAAEPAPSAADSGAAGRPSRSELELLLRRHGGNVTAAAGELGKGKMQIYRWLRHYGLHPDQFR